MKGPPGVCSEGLLEALLERIAQQDATAMEEFRGLVRGMVLVWLRRILRDPSLVEEGEQDVYRHIWLKAGSFDRARHSPFAWMRTITRSRAIDCLRAHHRQRVAVQPEWWERNLICREAGPELQVQYRRRNTMLLGVMERLKPEQRGLVVLAFYEDLSHDEISRRTGTPLGTVKTRIRKALSLMRATLEGVGMRAQD